jgi:hypothetical protein
MPPNPTTGGIGWAWSAIRGAVADRANTAQLWTAVRQVAAATGQELPSGAFRAVNALRSRAVQLRTAGEVFARAEPDQLVTGQMLPVGVTARNATERLLLPMYKITFDLEMVDSEGELQVKTVSMVDNFLPGLTVGEAQDAVMEAAEGLSQEYGMAYSGVANLWPEMI